MATGTGAVQDRLVDDVLERIDGFCDTVPRMWASVHDEGPLRLFTRTTPGWPFYARPIPGGAPIRAADVERIRTLQRSRGVPEAFEWVLAVAPSMATAVAASGLAVRVCPVLVLDGDIRPAPLPTGYSARLLGPADADLRSTANTVHAVAAAAFGALPGGALNDHAFAALRQNLADGVIARALITGPDGPVAAGSAQRVGDVVELAGIGTAREARGRGLGAALTALLAAATRDAGADLVFLAAGDDTASRVYQRVGFRRVGECGIAEAG